MLIFCYACCKRKKRERKSEPPQRLLMGERYSFTENLYFEHQHSTFTLNCFLCWENYLTNFFSIIYMNLVFIADDTPNTDYTHCRFDKNSIDKQKRHTSYAIWR